MARPSQNVVLFADCYMVLRHLKIALISKPHLTIISAKPIMVLILQIHNHLIYSFLTIHCDFDNLPKMQRQNLNSKRLCAESLLWILGFDILKVESRMECRQLCKTWRAFVLALLSVYNNSWTGTDTALHFK